MHSVMPPYLVQFPEIQKSKNRTEYGDPSGLNMMGRGGVQISCLILYTNETSEMSQDASINGVGEQNGVQGDKSLWMGVIRDSSDSKTRLKL